MGNQEKNGIESQEMSIIQYRKQLLEGIDAEERTEWEKEKQEVSFNIAGALVEQLKQLNSQSKKIGNAWDTNFLDYCNCVKSLLAVYNFGYITGYKNAESDKQLIKTCIENILEHVKIHGFDITPYFEPEECVQIFGDGENSKITYPITISAATVMTTLVYFRRAYSRQGIYNLADLTTNKDLGLFENSTDLNHCVAQVVAYIMCLFANYSYKNRFSGWGFTLDYTKTQAVTLNDTYAVIDAISRFYDAFNQDDETKRDEWFLNKVNKYSIRAFNWENTTSDLVTYCGDAMYRTAYNIYARDKSRLYGKNMFYITHNRVGSKVEYTYNPIGFEQIASSNRSSALFNPLYVAMITMLGYNEKEIVIRYLMDAHERVKRYYDDYEPDNVDDLPDGVKKTISQYAKELAWFKADFKQEAQMLMNSTGNISESYDFAEWQRYYNIARVFQKYLETQVPDKLMEIEQYRDYLNATKDAIDQVQVAYRKFDDSQRLGIVDTDYIMFSSQDFISDSVTISKLNKLNMSANYLRPLLLSSKIMIVNALTRYPQSDMVDIYNAIKESKHRKVVKSGGKNKSTSEWLWNEDTVDMNSTARHCEAIMYDYFDYYEKYELSYQALRNIRRYYGRLTAAENINFADGTFAEDKLLAESNLCEFKRVVINMTRQCVDKISVSYAEYLREKEKEYRELERKKDKEYQALEQSSSEKISELIEKYEKALEQERKKHAAEMEKLKISIEIGDTVREWIRAESVRSLSDMLSYMILNNINGRQDKDEFRIGKMMYGAQEDEIADGDFYAASEISKDIMAEYKEDAAAAEQMYGDKFREALGLQRLLEYAIDDLLKHDHIRNVMSNDNVSLEGKNEAIREFYNKWKYKRTIGIYNMKDTKEKPGSGDGESDND